MKDKFNLKATKTVKLKTAHAVFSLFKKETDEKAIQVERGLLDCYLNDTIGLDETERKTLHYKLIRNGFIRGNGQLTEPGEKLLNEGELYRWYGGVGTLWYLDEPALRGRLLHAELHKASDTLSDSATELEELSGYKEMDNRWFRDISSGERVCLRFIRKEGGPVKVVPSRQKEAELKVSKDGTGETEIEITVRDETLSGVLEGIDLSVDNTIRALFPEISNNGSLSVRMSYEEASGDRRILRSFQVHRQARGPLWINSVMDEDWQIEVTLPVLPATKTDATKWVEDLLIEELSAREGYITREGLRMIFNRVLRESTIPEAFKDWHFSLEAFIENLKKRSPEHYLSIKAAEDLWVDYEMATTKPEDLKRKYIVVDGSNVAWNNGDRQRGDRPLARNIELMYEYLRGKGYSRIITFCDANLRYLVKDPEKFDELLQRGIIIEVPAKTIADYFIIEEANRYDCYIVSNDHFRDWTRKRPLFSWKGTETKTKKFIITPEGPMVYELEVN